jgi:hypothetical protein
MVGFVELMMATSIIMPPVVYGAIMPYAITIGVRVCPLAHQITVHTVSSNGLM